MNIRRIFWVMAYRVVRFQDTPTDDGKSSAEQQSLSIENYRFEPGMSFPKYSQIIKSITDDDVKGDKETIFSIQEKVQRITAKNPRGFHKDLRCPSRYSEAVWLAEIMRQLVIDLNHLVGRLGDVCSCEDMTTNNDQIFICASHKQQQNCNALEYCSHTIDSFTTKLHSEKLFPSRIKIKQQTEVLLRSYARRLFRILAHAHHHHKNVWREQGKWESWRLYLEGEKLHQANWTAIYVCTHSLTEGDTVYV